MTNEMVLERKSNLVMPTHYVELDSEEMCYVEGGRHSALMSWSAEDAWTGVVAIASLAFGLGALGQIYNFTGVTMFVAGEVVCKVVGMLFRALGWLASYFATSLAIAAAQAADYASSGRGFTLYLEKAWIIPVGFSVS